MYAVLGEDRSDVEMIQTLIRRIANSPNVAVSRKGYQGAPEMLAKAPMQIQAYKKLGASRFIVCYDSDGYPAEERHKEIVQRVLIPANVDAVFCALVPVQEIESWVLSDIDAVAKVHTSWRPPQKFSHPEHVIKPKEFLEKMTQQRNLRPLYNHKTHNPQVAKHLSLQQLASKCPSSLPLFDLVQLGLGNHPKQQVKESDKERIHRIVSTLRKAGIN